MASVAETILTRVVARLETQLAGDVVLPEKQGDYSPSDNQTVVAVQMVRNPDLDYPDASGLVTGWTLQLQCQHNILPSEFDCGSENTLPMLQLRRAAIIQKGLTSPESDGYPWWNFGGDAINADIGNWEPYTSDDLSGVMVPCNIHFRHPENDPDTAR